MSGITNIVLIRIRSPVRLALKARNYKLNLGDYKEYE
jgi:hypothetical protein